MTVKMMDGDGSSSREKKPIKCVEFRVQCFVCQCWATVENVALAL